MRAPVGVILAGGQARRMGGGDKGRLPLGGVPILTRVIARLEPQVAGLALNANGDPDRFDDLGLDVLPDSVADHPGPLAGVLAGLDWAAEQGADHIVTAAADTPFFPCDLVPMLQLAAERAGAPIALAATMEGTRQVRHPVFGLWPVALREDLRLAIAAGTRKVVIWTGRHGAVEAVFPVERFDPFFNVNTPDDLARAHSFLDAP
ncbi:molybdenum cofactor guanylyltransferase MobA [Profundibacterium mesophilum]|uniref:Molybdenum cofactor guanylyltransferase n=1 Tax=Profundibacterium mesophilum KAUST100406-0324 TaxID=1037889 RepID=A0A921NPW6_9RHOB|nr:molybdenum cofactor guanylyltransferase MobA [Profundibacterium mesophilum]KAF0676431.1 Molybdenum cofactor guanylyltransferase [Profundibacterium mesophilum KAUST100406-0324]